ncbi:hypothetical protein AWB68_00681 [Caballeronia choica]|uniref:Uncharacterized protein n=1 Tax=Caballeronia choica TaxID=326476 RepID=A0A158FIS9_9BURK|nr:hypothetical protein [Caballeronia choica]SAL19744.1 hypothetical protein AWB68_00681 [Caballeronia choica]
MANYPAAPSFVKDPVSVLDFQWDWSEWLGEGETLSDKDVSADDGVTVNSSSIDGPVVSAWIAGGTSGKSYNVKCKVTTSSGRVDARTISIDVRNR